MKQPITLPHNLDAEISLLGCLLLKGSIYSEIAEKGLVPEDFWEIRHQHIFRAIHGVYQAGRTPDLVTVGEELTKHGGLELIGGTAYLAELMDTAQFTSTAALKDYADIIREKSLHRRFIKICEEHASLSYRQESDFDTIIDHATNELIRLSLLRQTSAVVPIDEVIVKEMESLHERLHQKQMLQGLTSGYTAIDNLTTGFKPGEMIVVAGRPGMGKTSFALNMAVAMAKKGATVLFFTIEMPASQVVRRIFSIECLVNARNFTTGQLTEEEFLHLWRNIDTLGALSFYIDESSFLTVADVRSKAKKVFVESKTKKLDVVFIDYLQLMRDTTYTDDRVREVENISRNIKLFAKDLHIPVIVLAQLSRKAEDRKDGIPMLSDLRDSGAIEQDADVVMFIHRDMTKDENAREMTSIIIRKNRNGQTGDVKLRFIPHYTKFIPVETAAEEID